MINDRKKITKRGLTASLIAFLVSVSGHSVFADVCDDFPNDPGCHTTVTLPDAYTSILNTVLAVTGVISVIVIIISGIMITTSQGDPTKVKKARSSIVYALIGLAVSLLAFTIVNFVLDNAI